MSGLSGKNGTILIGAVAIAEITGWSFNPTSNNPSWSGNTNSGYKARVAGVKDASGSFEFKVQDATEVAKFEVGTLLTLLLHADGSTTLDYSVPSIVDGVTVEVDIDDGDVVSGSCDFSSNGAWTEPT